MGLFDDLKNVVSQYASGGSADEMLDHFHKVAESADHGTLSNGIAAAMRSDETPAFADIVSQLFANASGAQQAGMLEALLGAAPADLKAKLGALLPGAGGAMASLTGGQGAPISADLVSSVARQVEEHNPGVIEHMSAFYAQHPALVKTLGAAAVAVAMRKMAEHRA